MQKEEINLIQMCKMVMKYSSSSHTNMPMYPACLKGWLRIEAGKIIIDSG